MSAVCDNCGASAVWASIEGGFRLVALVGEPVHRAATPWAHVTAPVEHYWLEQHGLPRREGGPPPFAHKLHPDLVTAAGAAGLLLAILHRELCPHDAFMFNSD